MSDSISRQAAIDALNGQITVTGDINAKAVQNYIRMVNQRLHDLPSAQPERKTGRWIVIPAPDDLHCGLVKCPFCDDEYIAKPNEHNYCPNCGARMEGDD